MITMQARQDTQLDATEGQERTEELTGNGAISPSRPRQGGRRLWILWHVQVLLDGVGSGPDDVAFIEDDRRRMAGGRAR
jgi:hypothetical protein